MIVVSICLGVLLIISLVIIYNLVRKQEKYEDILVEYLNYLDSISRTIDITDIKLKEIDEEGTFKSDDEIGFFFESIGDLQLSIFLEHPENRGKIMTHGLWSWTRHPNYFGEVAQWWGIFFIALSSPAYWYASLIGPLTITFLILKVSGIPLLEKRYEGNEEFDEYKK